jgi:nitroreductase
VSTPILDEKSRLELVAEANLAPSVHNIQPTRFRFLDDDVIEIHEDPSRGLSVGDPTGADNAKSLGAATEGLVIALAARNIATAVSRSAGAVACVRLRPAADPDPHRAFVHARATWRGAFDKPTRADLDALEALGSPGDLVAVTDPARIADIAALYDETSLSTLRDSAYRAELVSWMRLSRRHGAYDRDGLNADAMALTPMEAIGAGVVMGRAFPFLDGLGLARPLVAEGAKVKGAAGVLLFHRDAAEAAFDTGRCFYRVWLEFTARGLSACPMSVLADSPAAATQIKSAFGIGADRKLVTAFRIGRKPAAARQPPRVRLPAHELIV